MMCCVVGPVFYTDAHQQNTHLNLRKTDDRWVFRLSIVMCSTRLRHVKSGIELGGNGVG